MSLQEPKKKQNSTNTYEEIFMRVNLGTKAKHFMKPEKKI